MVKDNTMFRMEIALDNEWMERLFILHAISGGSNTSLGEVIETALKVGIAEGLGERK